MLEQVIRPFQSPGSIADKVAPLTRPLVVTPELAILTWGAAGQAPTLGGTGLKVKTDKKLKEVSRKTHDVRIENPDDSSQYVMEKRIDTITFSEKSTKPTVITPSGSDSTSTTPANNNSGGSAGIEDNTAYAPSPTSDTAINNPTAGVNVDDTNDASLPTSEYTLDQTDQPAP